MSAADLTSQPPGQLARALAAVLFANEDGERRFDDDQVLLCLLDLFVRAGQEAHPITQTLLQELAARAGAAGLSPVAAREATRKYRAAHPVSPALVSALTAAIRGGTLGPEGLGNALAKVIGTTSTTTAPRAGEPIDVTKTALSLRLQSTAKR